MGLTLYNLLKAVLLLTNSLAILHPHRFLATYQLDTVGEGVGVKQQLGGLLHATRFMRCASYWMEIHCRGCNIDGGVRASTNKRVCFPSSSPRLHISISLSLSLSLSLPLSADRTTQGRLSG